MKILFLPAYFYPEQAASSYLGVNRFEAYEREGFDMVVFAPTPSRGISKKVREVYSKRKKERMYGDRMIVHRFSLFKEGKNPLMRAFRYTIQLINHFFRAAFSPDAKTADVVFLSSTPPIQGILGAMVKKCCKKKFIYCLQDVFPDSLVGAGFTKKGGLFWKIGRMIENFTYRNADKIIVISEEFKRNIMAKGVPKEKIEVIYNWVDEKLIIPIDKADNPFYKMFNLDRNKFRVVYAGNLGNAQNIDVIINSAARLKDNKQVEFVIFGSGGLENNIKKRITTENLQNVRMLPLQPPEKVSCVYSLGDLCIVSCKAGFGGSAMPSKTWNILSTGRPVLANFDEGELKRLIEENGFGIFTKADDVDGMVNAILEASLHPERCDEMGHKGRRFILKNLTREVGTQKYIDVIKSVVKI